MMNNFYVRKHSMQNEKLDAWKQQMAEFRFPRWNELPEINLYMDQVVGYLNQKLSALYGADGDIGGVAVTATMINNYVKQRIISAPVKKRYDRACVSALIVLFCAKQIMSIGMTGTLLARCRWDEHPEIAYDRFCDIFEAVLHITVSGGGYESIMSGLSGEERVVMAAAVAFANKLFAETLLLLDTDAPEDGKPAPTGDESSAPDTAPATSNASET